LPGEHRRASIALTFVPTGRHVKGARPALRKKTGSSERFAFESMTELGVNAQTAMLTKRSGRP
jgi:hypothetical protein